MSLPPTSCANSNSNNGLDARQPPLTDPAPEANYPTPEVKTKKRKREILDDMDVGGATSEESIDEKNKLSSTEKISEPKVKRRRTIEVDAETRERVSHAIADNDLNALKKIFAAIPGCLNHIRAEPCASPLLEAVWFNHTGIVRWLLEQGADPDLTGSGFHESDIESDNDELSDALIQRYRPKLKELKTLTSNDAYLLGPSALVHAALHGDLELIKLLLDFQVSIDTHDERLTALAGAVVGRHEEIVRFLLEKGADPTYEFEEFYEIKNTLSLALEVAQFHLVPIMLESIAEEKRQAALKDAIVKSAKKLSADFIESLMAWDPRLTQEILNTESPAGQPWLLEVMLEKWNLALVRFLIEQGCTYKIRSVEDLNLAVNVSPDKALIVLMLKGIESQDLREKFFSHCLYRNLMLRNLLGGGAALSASNQWLIDEAGVSPLYVPDVLINTDSLYLDWGEALFHVAVKLNARDEVSKLMNKYPNINVNVEGLCGKYPIELAAELGDPSLFLKFSQVIAKGDQQLLILIWIDIFERAAIKHQNADAFVFIKTKLAECNVDSRFNLLSKIINERHWKALEFFVMHGGLNVFTKLIDQINAKPAVDRVMMIDLLLKTSELHDRGMRNMENIVEKRPASAIQIIEDLSRHVGKNNQKFKRSCLKLAQASGLTGIIIERAIEIQAMLSFIRQALLGGGDNSRGFSSQFSHFIAHWLPVTDACSWYLISDAIYKQPNAPSSNLCLKLTTETIEQLDNLHQTAKLRQHAWARKLVDELPALCLRLVDAKNDDVDEKTLQGELIQRDIVAPNAIRLAGLMRRAYQSARTLTGGVLQSPALQLKQFSAQFLIELAKLIYDDEDKSVTQRATADALMQLSQPTYRDLHLPQGMNSDLEEQSLEMLADLVWWQMDAIFNCVGKSVAGESDAYARDYGPFIEFKTIFKNLYAHFPMLEKLRAGFTSNDIGSGPLHSRDFFGRPNQLDSVIH
jgi:hypothetical protein